MEQIFLTECPRDAIQGISKFIPTSQKALFIKTLCKVGFDVLDMGSFVSPKAVPQLQDTHDVLKMLTHEDKNNTLFLAIIANLKGAELALNEDLIDIIGFPFSISEQFQIRNTNSTRDEALETVKTIFKLIENKNKKLRVYLSMAFGNPYNEEWNVDILLNYAQKLIDIGVKELAISDTIGNSNEKNITEIFTLLINKFPSITISAHFHSRPNSTQQKINAAFNAGCRFFDTALNGMGGCPFAKDELVGNISTQKFLQILPNKKINLKELKIAEELANQIYASYH